jgi:hypothetical protein
MSKILNLKYLPLLSLVIIIFKILISLLKPPHLKIPKIISNPQITLNSQLHRSLTKTLTTIITLLLRIIILIFSKTFKTLIPNIGTYFMKESEINSLLIPSKRNKKINYK